MREYAAVIWYGLSVSKPCESVPLKAASPTSAIREGRRLLRKGVDSVSIYENLSPTVSRKVGDTLTED